MSMLYRACSYVRMRTYAVCSGPKWGDPSSDPIGCKALDPRILLTSVDAINHGRIQNGIPPVHQYKIQTKKILYLVVNLSQKQTNKATTRSSSTTSVILSVVACRLEA